MRPRFGSSAAERAAAREAWSQPRFAFYRWFAEEPVLLRVDSGNPSTCAWFQDLRFFTPGRDTWPFRYGMCREEGGRGSCSGLMGTIPGCRFAEMSRQGAKAAKTFNNGTADKRG